MYRIALFLALIFFAGNSYAQTAKRGFDYNSHAKMNKKAKRWGEKRNKATKGDMTNLKCSPRESRRYARKQRS
jgi:hypothetical protein